MSALRPAHDDEVARLWPAVRAARLFATSEDFAAYRDAGPWRVRVSDAGEAMVLGAWREGQDLLWIKGMWGGVSRVADMVSHAAAVAAGQGYARLLSPLLSEDAFKPHAEAGMEPLEFLVALQAPLSALEVRPGTGPWIRTGCSDDAAALLEVDAECFEPFWRYGHTELGAVVQTERLTVAVVDGVVVGYATLAVHGGSATLGRLAVATGMRSRGVGQALLAEQAEYARASGAGTLTLCTQETNEGARAFYARCAMTELHVRYVLGVCAV